MPATRLTDIFDTIDEMEDGMIKRRERVMS